MRYFFFCSCILLLRSQTRKSLLSTTNAKQQQQKKLSGGSSRLACALLFLPCLRPGLVFTLFVSTSPSSHCFLYMPLPSLALPGTFESQIPCPPPHPCFPPHFKCHTGVATLNQASVTLLQSRLQGRNVGHPIVHEDPAEAPAHRR